MTILDFLRANPGKHTAKQIATALSIAPSAARIFLIQSVRKNQIIGHEQHGKIVYEHREPRT